MPRGSDSARDGRREGGMRLLHQVEALLLAGGLQAGTLTIGAIRSAIPVFELLSGVSARSFEGANEPDRLGFTRGEWAVLTQFATLMLLEAIEIASVTDPLYKDAPRYVAYNDGVLQRPHLMHVLALVAAINRYFRTEDEKPPAEPDASHSVTLLALAPGEIVPPLQPSEIRRLAMTQRAITKPQAAMYVRGSDPPQFMAAPATGTIYAAAYGQSAAKGTAASMATGCGCGGASHGGCKCGGDCGCGCGGKCGGCESCGHNHAFAPARRKPDGSCDNIFSISCDTRWRVRECLKIAVCDFVRCLGEEVCDDECRIAEQPDIRRCVEGFVCTLLGCLPDAICPPPEPKPVQCCIEAPRSLPDCRCNFAVGD